MKNAFEKIPEDISIHTAEEGSEWLSDPEHGKRVLEILRDPESFIGKGFTARVHFGQRNQDICYKIIPDTSVDFYRPPFNDVTQEFDFLKVLRGISSKDACVPMPYAAIKGYTPMGREIHLLILERFDAVCVGDVLVGNAALPGNFDPDVFEKKALTFLENMHAQKIYHRDLLRGMNIMIDNETGNPRFIDFGNATHSYFDENPYLDETYGIKRRFPDDNAAIKTLVRRIKDEVLT